MWMSGEWWMDNTRRKRWGKNAKEMFCINDGNRRWRCAQFQTHLIIHLSLIYISRRLGWLAGSFVRSILSDFGMRVTRANIYILFYLYFKFACRLRFGWVLHIFFTHFYLNFIAHFSIILSLCSRAFGPANLTREFSLHANTPTRPPFFFMFVCLVIITVIVVAAIAYQSLFHLIISLYNRVLCLIILL